MIKLLFDQNISFRVLKLISKEYTASKQVRSVGLEGATDQEIWNYARKNDYAIVTYDADFADIACLRGIPPKIVWLRTGNLTTKEIAKLLNFNKIILSNFLLANEYKDVACIELE